VLPSLVFTNKSFLVIDATVPVNVASSLSASLELRGGWAAWRAWEPPYGLDTTWQTPATGNVIAKAANAATQKPRLIMP
jgi:hypothetical protein